MMTAIWAIFSNIMFEYGMAAEKPENNRGTNGTAPLNQIIFTAINITRLKPAKMRKNHPRKRVMIS